MAERLFLSQYIAVSREKRLRILIEQSFYSLVLFSVSEVSSYFLFLTFMQLFRSKLKRTILSVLVNFQILDSERRTAEKNNWKIHFYITEINFKPQSSFLFSLKVELMML